MKLLYFFSLCIFMITACNSKKGTESTGFEKLLVTDKGGEWMKFDEETKARFDNRSEVLWDNIINSQYEKTSLDTDFYGPGVHDLSYYLDDGEFVSITSSQSNDQIATRLQFYLENDQLVFARLREWSKKPISGTASEIIIYLKNGEPVYAEERSVVLKEGGIPAILNDIDLLPTTRSKAELIAELDKFWPDLISRVYEDMTK